MKANILIIFIFPLLFSSCVEDTNLRAVNISGKIVSVISGKGIANATLISKVNTYGGSGILSYVREISSQRITTDTEGNFSATLYYENSGNVFLFDKEDDEYSTQILTSKKNFYLSELEGDDLLIFNVRKFEELEIKVKSIVAYDEDDTISVSIYESNTNYIRGVIYSIKNFGNINESWGLLLMKMVIIHIG